MRPPVVRTLPGMRVDIEPLYEGMDSLRVAIRGTGTYKHIERFVAHCIFLEPLLQYKDAQAVIIPIPRRSKLFKVETRFSHPDDTQNDENEPWILACFSFWAPDSREPLQEYILHCAPAVNTGVIETTLDRPDGVVLQ